LNIAHQTVLSKIFISESGEMPAAMFSALPLNHLGLADYFSRFHLFILQPPFYKIVSSKNGVFRAPFWMFSTVTRAISVNASLVKNA
jgi:hypothetical protein